MISGGKDSVYNLLECRRLGHRIVALANLYPAPAAGEETPDELDSFMIQTVGHTAIECIAACMGIPLVRQQTSGHSHQRTLHYDAAAATIAATAGAASGGGDEVEDLLQLLRAVKERFPSVAAVSCGAILSNYQRLRVEAVAQRVGLLPLTFMWQRSQRNLLDDMIAAGIDAVLVKVAAYGLTARMLGRPLAALQPALLRAEGECGLNVCGEGGEYESIVLDCPPLFAHGRVQLVKTSVVHTSYDSMSPIAHLRIEECRMEPKDDAVAAGAAATATASASDGASAFPSTGAVVSHTIDPSSSSSRAADAPDVLPPGIASVRPWVSGSATACSTGTLSIATLPPPLLAAVLSRRPELAVAFAAPAAAAAAVAGAAPPALGSATAAASPTAAEVAAAQMHVILECLRVLLAAAHPADATLADVSYVHLYLADMAHFGPVNAAYCQYFGAHPPSRSCVQVPLCGDVSFRPAGSSSGSAAPVVLVCADALAVAGSGAQLRAHDFSARSTLHVASLSRWAPLCIGPYCQANTLERAGIVALAGQIGLIPETMQLESGGFAPQLQRSIANAMRLLAACNSVLQHALAVTVYVSTTAPASAAAMKELAAGLGTAHDGATPQLEALQRVAWAAVAACMHGRFGQFHSARLAEWAASGDRRPSDEDIDAADASGSDEGIDCFGEGCLLSDAEKCLVRSCVAQAPRRSAATVCYDGADTAACSGGAGTSSPTAAADAFDERRFDLGVWAHRQPVYAAAAAATAASDVGSSGKPGHLPILVVPVPFLPRGAAVEVEVTAATHDAALGVRPASVADGSPPASVTAVGVTDLWRAWCARPTFDGLRARCGGDMPASAATAAAPEAVTWLRVHETSTCSAGVIECVSLVPSASATVALERAATSLAQRLVDQYAPFAAVHGGATVQCRVNVDVALLSASSHAAFEAAFAAATAARGIAAPLCIVPTCGRVLAFPPAPAAGEAVASGASVVMHTLMMP